ncbi:MAG: hypothetical protein EBS05_20640 [Proteobacteria bacterium]|nr:hypothetical protein [Pseudomonadota bacterium]
MMQRFACTALLLAAGLVGEALSAQSQTASTKQNLDAAQKKLADVTAVISKAEAEAHKADTAHQAAVAKVQKARQSAAVTIGAKLGMPAAVAQRDAATRTLEAAQKALSKEIRTQADYLAAAKEADLASTKLGETRDDTKLSEEKKKELTAELSKTIRKPTELEKDRIEADGNLKQLRIALAEAGKQVASIQTEVMKTVDEQPEVKTALQAEREDADKAKKAHEEVDKHKKDLAAAQKAVAVDTQKAQAQAKKKTKPGK